MELQPIQIIATYRQGRKPFAQEARLWGSTWLPVPR